MRFLKNIINRISNIPVIGKFINKETINYLIFGILTTVVSYVSFIAVILLSGLSNGEDGYMLVLNIANVVSWILAVAFAYITNKLFVFESRSFSFKIVLREAAAFAGARLFSFGCEIIWMNIVVGKFEMNESVAKILANVFVMIMNYFFSKFFIFGEKSSKVQKEGGLPVGKGEFFKRKYQENKFVWGTFILSAFVMVAVYIFMGYFPVDDNIVLKIDMYHQYAPFHEELRNKLLEGGSFFYSWDSGMGKNFLAQFAYYTASPISFLMIFFPTEYIGEAMAFFILLKVAFAAAFFAYYLKKKFKRDDVTIVIFGLMYASMAFMTSYFWNVMWLDAVALFPLVALGIESLILEKKYKMYCISLAAVIIVNFYIAFIVCVFSALYFCVFIFSVYSIKKDIKIIINRFFHFALLSLIAGGSSMILNIPVLIALSNTDTVSTAFPAMKIYDNIYQIITNHFIGARPVVLARNEDLPNIYSGLLTIMLIPAYYLNKVNIKRKEKVLFSVFLAFMLICCVIQPLTFIIHGFHFPSNLPHRFSFIYSFTLLAMAYKGFIHIRSINFKKYIVIILILFAIPVCTEYIIVPINKNIDITLEWYDFLLSFGFGAAYLVLLYKIFKGRKSNVRPLAVIVVLVFAECIFSTATGVDYTGKTQRSGYVAYVNAVENINAYTNEKDGNDFYRTEMHRFLPINEGSLYHYKGFNIFSSLASGKTSAFMRALGTGATGNSYRIQDSTPLFESMFNIKYIIKRKNTPAKQEIFYDKIGTFLAGTKEEEEILSKTKEILKEFKGSDDLNQIKNFDSDERKEFNEKVKAATGVKDIDKIKGINPDSSSDYVTLYENPDVLPLGFLTNSYIKEWTMRNDNPFKIENQFINYAANITDEVFDDIPIDEVKSNTVDDENGRPFYLVNFYRPVEKGSEKTTIVSHKDFMDYVDNQDKNAIHFIRYSLSSPDFVKEDSYKPVMSFKLTVDKEKGDKQRVFLYVDGSNAQNVKYVVKNENGEKVSDEVTREVSTGKGFIDLGKVDGGCTIEIDFNLSKKGQYELSYRTGGNVRIYAATFNEKAFKKGISKLKESPMVVTDYGDDYVNGEIDAKEDGYLYLSIPYDEGWSIKVDGEEVEKATFGNGGLLGADLKKGKHTINLSYYPEGFNIGMIISGVSVIMFIIYMLVVEKKKKTVTETEIIETMETDTDTDDGEQEEKTE